MTGDEIKARLARAGYETVDGAIRAARNRASSIVRGVNSDRFLVPILEPVAEANGGANSVASPLVAEFWGERGVVNGEIVWRELGTIEGSGVIVVL